MRNQLTRLRQTPSTWPLIAAVFIAATLCDGTIAFAQDSTSNSTTSSDRAVTRSPAGSPLQAAVVREGVRLAQSLDAAAPAPGAQPRHWVTRHPVIVGALIGTGAGAVLSQTRTAGGNNHDPRVALPGTAIGAWGGLIASAVQQTRLKEPVSIGTKVAIVAGAISLVVLPLVACYGAGGCGGVS